MHTTEDTPADGASGGVLATLVNMVHALLHLLYSVVAGTLEWLGFATAKRPHVVLPARDTAVILIAAAGAAVLCLALAATRMRRALAWFCARRARRNAAKFR